MKTLFFIFILNLPASAEALIRRMIDNHETVIQNQLTLQLYSFTTAPFEKINEDQEARADMATALVDCRMGTAELFFALYLEWSSHGVDFKSNRIWRSRASMIRKMFKSISIENFKKHINTVGAEQMNTYFTNYDKKNLENDMRKFMAFLKE
jgi:hypothetical protein